MSTMQAVYVTGPGTVEVREVARPTAGPADVLLKVRACGICGSDAFYTQIGGIPPRQGDTPARARDRRARSSRSARRSRASRSVTTWS